jgi:hypothetical protein
MKTKSEIIADIIVLAIIGGLLYVNSQILKPLPPVNEDQVKEMIEKVDIWETIKKHVKPKYFWQTNPEWEAFKYLKEKYSGIPLPVRENLDILYKWAMTEIVLQDDQLKRLKRELIGTKKRLLFRLWNRRRNR